MPRKKQTTEPIIKSNGLFDNLVFTILEDNDQNLWMTCDRGIYSVNKNSLKLFTEGKINKIPYRSW